MPDTPLQDCAFSVDRRTVLSSRREKSRPRSVVTRPKSSTNRTPPALTCCLCCHSIPTYAVPISAPVIQTCPNTAPLCTGSLVGTLLPESPGIFLPQLRRRPALSLILESIPLPLWRRDQESNFHEEEKKKPVAPDLPWSAPISGQQVPAKPKRRTTKQAWEAPWKNTTGFTEEDETRRGSLTIWTPRVVSHTFNPTNHA